MFEKVFAKQHIRNLDLSSVRAKLVEKMGWSPEQAQTVEIDYKRFLYALVHNEEGDVLSPNTGCRRILASAHPGYAKVSRGLSRYFRPLCGPQSWSLAGKPTQSRCPAAQGIRRL
jgi:hypothetical protein